MLKQQLTQTRMAAAHTNYCLPLLPSGPDGVHRSALRRSQLSSPLTAQLNPQSQTRGKASIPLQRIAGYREPLPPHLARQILYQNWRRRRDLNPRYGCAVHTLSKRAPSATRTLLQSRLSRASCTKNILSSAVYLVKLLLTVFKANPGFFNSLLKVVAADGDESI